MSFNFFEACERFKEEEEAAIRFIQDKVVFHRRKTCMRGHAMKYCGKVKDRPSWSTMAMSQGRVLEESSCAKRYMVRRGQVGAEQASNFRMLMEPWVYDNGILFPQIRDEQQLCGWIAEMPA
uniref:Uncharacterized protein n=1 Tax=Trichuris muris TaxID=70415 RepID=A0A5S6QQ40_TRIMR